MKYFVDPDIRRAETLPGSFYHDETAFLSLKELVFRKTWQWVGDESLLPPGNTISPITLLESFLSEPLVLTRGKDNSIRCLSNVCTHRGNLVARNPDRARALVCGYHGRTFDLDGTFRSMPEFKDAVNFPRPCENLKSFDLVSWKSHLFVGLEPAFQISGIFDRLNERVGFLPVDQFKKSESLSKEYLVNCHWALYCDNYLEGFHIPFVHEGLNKVVDYGSYTTIPYEYLNLQIGYTNQSEDIFDLPKGHPDFGKRVAAYYYWIFPNLMLNFYPWGLSVNLVRPLDLQRTKVSFITYVFDESKLTSGAGALLDKVEREDEHVVEGVNRGLKSRFYTTGRFSPSREIGVHQFHLLLAKHLNAG